MTVTKPVPCQPDPGPLEGYAARFDDLFTHVAQRRGFREYLAGLLAPRNRNKMLTALAGAEPVAGAQHPAVLNPCPRLLAGSTTTRKHAATRARQTDRPRSWSSIGKGTPYCGALPGRIRRE